MAVLPLRRPFPVTRAAIVSESFLYFSPKWTPRSDGRISLLVSMREATFAMSALTVLSRPRGEVSLLQVCGGCEASVLVKVVI
jgi:hypothetical protein